MMTNLKNSVLWAGVCLSFISFSQSVLWADKVGPFSSQASSKSNSAQQLLGSPNAFPQGGKSFVAFQPLNKNVGEFIVVEFSKPSKAKFVLIAENYMPGQITQVEAKSAKGESLILHFQNAQKLNETSRIWKLPITRPDVEISSIKITIDCKSSKEIPQIDAIGLQIDDINFEPQTNKTQDETFTVVPMNLGAEVNSSADELMPVISPDGKTLYFVRDRHPGNLGKDKKEDIWYAKLTDPEQLTFSKAENIGRPLNNESVNAVTSVSPDGNSLLLLNVYKPKGLMDKGVSISKKKDNGWGDPEPLKIDDFYNDNPYNEFFLSASGNYLFMTLDRKEGYGQRDIYVSKRKDDNSWAAPVNLGPDINTAGDEASPYLAVDEKTLYFASDGYPGFGEHDLYFSKRKENTWTSWSEPINLGKDINTKEFDAYYTVDATGKNAYFVRENGSNKSDIYNIKTPKMAQPDPVVLVKGKILDVNTQEPIEADIVYQTLPDGKEAGVARSSPNTGEYQIILPLGQNYSFYARSPGYISESENLDLTKVIEYQEVERKIGMATFEKGQHIQLKSIFFETGKTTLLPTSYPELDRVVKLLKENPNLKIEVGGHTDDVGSHNDNMRLSTERAKSVEIYFEQHGIDHSRLKYKGYGETQPLVPNNSSDNRAKNRRVEFVILEK